MYYRNTIFRCAEIQIIGMQIYKLPKYQNTNYRNTEIQIIEIQKYKLQKYRIINDRQTFYRNRYIPFT